MQPAVLIELNRGLDLTGVAANAVLGGAVARTQRLDPVGFAVLSVLSGLGGGIIRDTLLQRGTPVALTDYAYLVTALLGSVIAFTVRFEGRHWDRFFPYVDALALGCWAAAGAQKTLAVGLGWLPALLLGTITAVGGGMVRDVVIREIPKIFAGTLYATCALAASAVMVLLNFAGLTLIGSTVATFLGAALYLLARWRGWELPQEYAWTRAEKARSEHGRSVRVPHMLEREGRENHGSERGDISMADTPRASALLAGMSDVTAWQEDFYRDLHSNPELSHQEHQTASKVAKRLRELGYEVQEGIGGTGVVGVLRNGDGPSVLLRADMDALPMREATGLPYTSTVTGTDANGNTTPVMHACGHDVHVTCLLGAAQLLAESPGQWNGTVIALFQPAEETGDGARGMVADGLGDRIPTPDVALGQHVLSGPAGKVATNEGPTLSAADSIEITVHGRGGHGSMPNSTVDPVVLAAMIVVRLQTVVSRETAPGETAVLTVGSIRSGTKSNIIPDHAVLEVSIRSYDQQTRSAILAAIRRIVTAECQASDSPKEPEFDHFNQFPLTDNDVSTTERVAGVFTEFFGDRAGTLGRWTASEDFSEVPMALGIPYTFWGFGGSDPDAYAEAERAGRVHQDIPSNHSTGFAPVIQPTLTTGTQALVVAALAWL